MNRKCLFVALVFIVFACLFVNLVCVAAQAEPGETVTNPVIAGILAVVGLLAGSGAALTWAKTNARQLGRRIAHSIPGDKIEIWLVAFLQGLIDGLEPESVEGVNKVLSMGVIKIK